MATDWAGWSSFIIAVSGLAGVATSTWLNRRGKTAEARQTEAAHELAERAQGFDEMQSYADRLEREISRLEERSERESHAQARRCRTALDHFMVAFITLQGQVASEVARRASERAQMEIEVHLAEDHPDTPTTPPAAPA